MQDLTKTTLRVCSANTEFLLSLFQLIEQNNRAWLELGDEIVRSDDQGRAVQRVAELFSQQQKELFANMQELMRSWQQQMLQASGQGLMPFPDRSSLTEAMESWQRWMTGSNWSRGERKAR